MKPNFKVYYENFQSEEAEKLKRWIVDVMVMALEHYHRKDSAQFNPMHARNAGELVNEYRKNAFEVSLKSYGYTRDSFNDGWNTFERFQKKVDEFAVDVITAYIKANHNVSDKQLLGKITRSAIHENPEIIEPAFRAWKQTQIEKQKGSKEAGANLDF